MTLLRVGELVWLGAACGLAGCSSDPAPPQTSVSWHFGPPEGSAPVPFPADPTQPKEKLLLASVVQSGFSVDGASVKWGASITRWTLAQLCDPDFGCSTSWQPVPDTLCFALTGTQAAPLDPAQCAPLLTPYRAAALPPAGEAQLKARLQAWSPGQQVKVTPVGGVALGPLDGQGHAAEWLGEVKVDSAVDDVYPGFSPGDGPTTYYDWSRRVVVRASTLPDGGLDEPTLELAPDGDAFLDRLYRNLRDGKPEYGFHTRDGAAVSLTGAPGPLSGQVLSPVTSRVAPGVAGVVVGQTAFAVYAGLRDRALSDIAFAQENNTGDILDLFVYQQAAPTLPVGLVQGLAPLHSEADAPDAARVCFGMPLDPATVTPQAVALTGAVLKGVARTSDGECLDLFVEALAPGTAAEATLTGLRSTRGAALPGPVRVGLYFGQPLPQDLGPQLGLEGLAVLPKGGVVGAVQGRPEELVVLGADLHSRPLLGAAIQFIYPDPSGPGAWAVLAGPGAGRVFMRLDGDAYPTVALPPLGGVAAGDGSLLLSDGTTGVWLKPDGTQAPVPPSAGAARVGLALGSPDIWRAVPHTGLVRIRPDGTQADAFPSAAEINLATSAETQGVTWLCGDMGLYRKDQSGWTQQRPACQSLGPAPGGTWLARLPGATFEDHEVVRLAGAALTPFTRRDPDPSASPHDVIERVDAFAGRVYLTTRLGIRMISLDQWSRIEQGREP